MRTNQSGGYGFTLVGEAHVLGGSDLERFSTSTEALIRASRLVGKTVREAYDEDPNLFEPYNYSADLDERIVAIDLERDNGEGYTDSSWTIIVRGKR